MPPFFCLSWFGAPLGRAWIHFGDLKMQTLFDYDLWSNRRWLACLQEQSLTEESTAIMRHILTAQQSWLNLICGDSGAETAPLEVNEETLHRLHQAWIAMLDSRDLDEVVRFTRKSGDEFAQTIGDIAQHVINHGTYHRGELRGLCRSRGETNFPETDFIAWKLSG
jgi:uncharacterized damage-inducible protein DinB